MGHEMPAQTPRGCVLVRGAEYHGKVVRLSPKDSGALLRPLRDLWKTAFHQKAILTAIITAANLGCKYNSYFKTIYVTWVLRTLSHTVQYARENSTEKWWEAGKAWSELTGLETQLEGWSSEAEVGAIWFDPKVSNLPVFQRVCATNTIHTKHTNTHGTHENIHTCSLK